MFCQLRESIGHDQEKTEFLKSQIQELEGNIRNVDSQIHHTEATIKELRKIQEQVSTKTAERSTLFKEQQKQYAALSEENEGLQSAKCILDAFSRLRGWRLDVCFQKLKMLF